LQAADSSESLTLKRSSNRLLFDVTLDRMTIAVLLDVVRLQVGPHLMEPPVHAVLNVLRYRGRFVKVRVVAGRLSTGQNASELPLEADLESFIGDDDRRMIPAAVLAAGGRVSTYVEIAKAYAGMTLPFTRCRGSGFFWAVSAFGQSGTLQCSTGGAQPW
jgi:hypothetical protein